MTKRKLKNTQLQREWDSTTKQKLVIFYFTVSVMCNIILNFDILQRTIFYFVLVVLLS
jgi:hypothetical protein